jgi:hypothetical protein
MLEMKQLPFPIQSWRFILAFGLTLATLLLFVPDQSSTAQEERVEQSRRLQQADAIAALPGKSKRWALVIAVDRYRDGKDCHLKLG